MLLAWHRPATNTPNFNLQVTLDALAAVAKNQTQPPHWRPDMSVLGHEDGSTPHLTAAGVILHVLTTSHVVGMATSPNHKQLQYTSESESWTWNPGCGQESDPAPPQMDSQRRNWGPESDQDQTPSLPPQT